MPEFHTIEISDPRFETNHLRQITVKSPSLGARGDITAWVPPGFESRRDLPAAVLLHGVYGSHWAWTGSGGAHLTALRLLESGKIKPMVLLMPSDGLWGDGSAYLPHHQANYGTWVAYDTIDCARKVIPQMSERSFRFIGGLSMGGYGALRLGAKYADRFHAVSAHSAVIHFKNLARFVEEPLAEYDVGDVDDRSILHWMMKNRSILPPIRLDCGLDDELLDENRQFHQELDRYKIPHQYEEFAGGHDWNYWHDHLEQTLIFFSQVIR